MKILTASQMREVDLSTTERYGIPSGLLMENAGSGLVQEMEKHFGDLRVHSIAVLCGKGNNGGDGFVVARHLIMRGHAPQVFLFAPPEDLKGDARTNYEILRKMGLSIRTILEKEFSEEKLEQLFKSLSASIVVDGLLGTGIRLPVNGFLAKVIQQLNQFPHVVAIDIPSGLECESLTFEPKNIVAPSAELTVTFTAPKPAHIFFPGAGYSKKWVVIPIGTPAELLNEPRLWLNYVTQSEAAQTLRKLDRAPESHKGDFGHVLAIGGSLGKTGAACMTAQSALHVGAGLVTLAVPLPCLPIVASQTLEIMTEALEATEVGSVSTKAFDYGRIETLLKGKDIIGLGPGLGAHPETTEFVRRLVRETRLPIVLDADGINSFAGMAEMLNGKDRILILTPHPGEFARLLGVSTQNLLANRIEGSRKFAQQQQVHLVLKGHRTLYASPSGQVYVNSSGNPGMATGGSGDVLTGMMAGLVGQGLPRKVALEESIILSVYLHGLAGDLAKEIQGDHSLVASDIMANISKAFLCLRSHCHN
ncbi:MAG: bifunctional ADP-dependent NAD(P)H-hydrate dehydratase/NAD(P)H-hydrate epimerase [Acidobacteria bacterium]|nr:MAG: bifunctional ADP-dependent NAD(P)H-hydrate dehydratase/NAD(P)H-hydrate epimerase [Acidobacteriota bacterium]